MGGDYKYLFVGGEYHGHVLTVASGNVVIDVLDDYGDKCSYYMHDIISYDMQTSLYVRVPVFVHQAVSADDAIAFVVAVLNGSQAIQPESSRFTAYTAAADQRWRHINCDDFGIRR